MNSTDRTPDPAHPWWCSATACRTSEVGILDDCGDLTLSSFGAGQHLGPVVAVQRQRFDEVLLSAQLASVGDEPVDETPVGVELTVTRPTYRSVEVYSLTADQARGLVVALAAMVPALFESGVRRREDVPEGCPSWCGEDHGGSTHMRLTGGVELFGAAFEAYVSEPACADGPAVTLYEHGEDITSVTSFSPAEAVELGLALLAAAALGGAR